MDYDAVLRLWADAYTGGLVDRKVDALRHVARHNAAGYRLADLAAIRDILTSGFSSLEDHGEPFVAPLCELLTIFGLPYRRARAHEERSSQALLADIIRVVIAVLVWDVPDIQLAAAHALEKFVRAEGFDETQYGEEGCWRLHQRLLLESSALSGLLVSLRHHLAVFSESGTSPDTGRSAVTASGEGEDSLGSGGYGGESDGMDGSAEEDSGPGSDTRRGKGEVQAHAAQRTYAVRAAAVRRAPEMLNILGRVVREASQTPDNALALNRLGAPSLLISIITHFTPTPREALLHMCVETLWNMLEHSAENFAAASVGGKADKAALSMSELLDKHRLSNAVRQMGTPANVLSLGALLESAVSHARTTADKEFRNDVLVLLGLLARKPENRPLFASTGVLALLLSFGTAPEMLGSAGPHGPASLDDPYGVVTRTTEVPLDRYATSSPADVEFKQLCWTLITTLTQGRFADFEVRTDSGPSSTSDGSGLSCISLVRSSHFVNALLAHLDPALSTPVPAEALMEATVAASTIRLRSRGSSSGGAGRGRGGAAPPLLPGQLPVHPYLAYLNPSARRALEILALDLLCVLAAADTQCASIGLDIVQAGACEVLTAYVRTYTDVLNGSGAAALAKKMAGSSSGPHPHPPSPTKLSHRQHKLLRDTAKSSLTLTGTNPGGGRSDVPFVGKHDTGRQHGALRLLHLLMDMGTRVDSALHLSAMVTAGVPTVVAGTKLDSVKDSESQTPGGEDSSSSSSDIVLGVRVACRLGELGLAEDLVAVLKALPTGSGTSFDNQAATVPPADKLTFSSFGRTWAGVTGDGGLGRTKSVSSGGSHGQGVTSVTHGALLAEGRNVVAIGLLKEEVLACLAALTRTAAYASASMSACLLHELMEAEAAAVDGGKHGGEEARGVREGRDGPSPVYPADIPGGGTTSAVILPPRPPGLGPDEVTQQAVLSAMTGIQDRVRKVGGVPAILRELAACTQECRKQAGGEFSTSASQPRVATVAAYALRCCTAGNVRSEARFLAESGIDVLLDLAEAACPTLLPVVLTALADLSRNPISHVCVRSWRSELSGASAGVMLLDMWRQEERRLGVAHDAATGALVNGGRPLDGADAAARQLALFSGTHKPTAAAVKRIRPGGRQSVIGGMPGAGILSGEGKYGEGAASPEAGDGDVPLEDRAERAEEDTSAFRALRRALRAAKMWQQVESATPGGPMATLTANMDVRHRIYACLQAVGFDEIDRDMVAAEELRKATAAAVRAAERGEGKSGQDEEEEGKGMEGEPLPSRAALDAASSLYSVDSSVHMLGNDTPVGQFPDLEVPHRVAMELVKAYPDFVRGGAWDDVRARLEEMGAVPLPLDAALLGAHLHATAATSARVRSLQLIHASRQAEAVVGVESAAIAGVVTLKVNEADALLFNERTKRKPGVTSGKAFAGLSMEEKKAGWAARTRMLGAAYEGYVPAQDSAVPTSDGMTWAQMDAVRRQQ